MYVIAVVVAAALSSRLGAQDKTAPSPLSYKVASTPVQITIAWPVVDGAGSYTVERSSSAVGPWTQMTAGSRETEITTPSPVAPGVGGQGLVLYYRVSAVGEAGTIARAAFAQVTPGIEAPAVKSFRQDHTDLTVYWSASPWASKYVVTATGGSGGNRSVDVDASATSLLLPNIAPGGNQSASINVAVRAVYEPGDIVAQGAAATIALAAVNACWPLGTVAGPRPLAAGLTEGVTSILTRYTNSVGGSSILYERSPAGAQRWETIGCLADGAQLLDVNLQPSTGYDYRVTSFTPASGMGQSIETRRTQAPGSATSISAIQTGRFAVDLNWRAVPGADGYRITSNYGHSIFVPEQQSVPSPTYNVSNMPVGNYLFTLTVVYPMMTTAISAPVSVKGTIKAVTDIALSTGGPERDASGRD